MSHAQRLAQALTEWAHILMHRSMEAFVRWMKENGLSRSQVGALVCLHHQGHCPVTNIGNELGITTPAASQLVDRLLQMGLLERSEDPDDRRVKVVALSSAGRELIEKGFGARRDWLNALASAFSEAEQLALAESLQALVEAANRIGDESETRQTLSRTG